MHVQLHNQWKYGIGRRRMQFHPAHSQRENTGMNRPPDRLISGGPAAEFRATAPGFARLPQYLRI
jgi:hypothetical protein